MGIPEKIRNVDRPANTVVMAYGKERDRYAVRSRIGCRNVNRRRVPVEGPIVGHIENGCFVPVDERTKLSECSVDLKDWANIKFTVFSSRCLLDELCGVYNRDDAIRLYCIAVLRTCYHGIKDDELKDAYDDSFLIPLKSDSRITYLHRI